jgi:starch synthase (maltosyl-transferring)
VVVNLDPRRTQEGFVHLTLDELGIGKDEAFQVEDRITGAVYGWRSAHNYVRLDPRYEPAHLLVVRR